MNSMFHRAQKAPRVYFALAIALVASAPQLAFAVTPSEIDADLLPVQTVSKIPSEKVSASYIDTLKKAATFSDYQVTTQLFTRKKDAWKDAGGAKLSYKAKDLIRAQVKTHDFNNGAVVVKQNDGKVRGRGGGMLRGMTMNLEPDARSLRLPTGYSLVESDFESLYDTLKSSLGSESVTAVSKTGVNLKLFKDPVLVFQVGTGDASNMHPGQLIFLNPRTKLPVGWLTYRGDAPNALVLFDELSPNKGLSEDLFRI
jgi:hypothetical protein